MGLLGKKKSQLMQVELKFWNNIELIKNFEV